MAEIVRRRSWGGVLPLGRHVSISGSRSIHAPSVSIAPSSFQEEQNARHHKQFKLEQALEDVPLLLEMFLTEAARRYHRDIPTFDGVMPYALSHTWPGNGLELRNFALRLVLGLNEDGSAYERTVSPPSLAQLMNRFEKQILVQQLRRHRGSVAAASEDLAIPKTTLYAKLEKHGISATVFRCGEPDGRG